MIPELKKLNPVIVKTARGKGLMNAIEIKPTDGENVNIYHYSLEINILNKQIFIFQNFNLRNESALEESEQYFLSCIIQIFCL